MPLGMPEPGGVGVRAFLALEEWECERGGVVVELLSVRRR